MSVVGPARPGERADALRLAFGHLEPDEARRRAAAALAMIDAGALDPDGLFIARNGIRLDGVMIAVVLTGRGGAVWPPAAASSAGYPTVWSTRIFTVSGSASAFRSFRSFGQPRRHVPRPSS